MRWRLCVLWVLALAGCRTFNWDARPDFPDVPNGRWAVPLHAPLTSANPFVWAELQGVPPSEGAPAPVLRRKLLIDSGSDVNALDAQTLAQLGVRVESRAEVQMRDAMGKIRPWKGALVPAMRTGPLEAREMVFSSFTDSNLIGRNFLDVHPWSLDLDRGLFVVGASPAPGAEVATMEMTRRDGNFYVEVSLDDRTLLLYFDTGATYAAVDRENAHRSGLKVHALGRQATLRTVHGTSRVDEIFLAELSFAGLHGGLVPVMPLRQFQVGGVLNDKVVGLLGFTAMARFNLFVEPGDEVQFQRRRDVLATARERIERWPWAPRCEEAPGCVDVTGGAEAAGGEVKLSYRGAYPDPVALLLACVDANGAVDHGLEFLEVTVAGAVAGRQDVVRFEGASPEWRKRASGRCGHMALIDVNPPDVPPPSADQSSTRFLRSVVSGLVGG